MSKVLLKKILGKTIVGKLRSIFRLEKRSAKKYFGYDCSRVLKYSGSFLPMTKGKLLSRIIMSYHVLEKGLTMPNRRYDFGREVLLGLIDLVCQYNENYGSDQQVEHAVGVVKMYFYLHRDAGRVDDSKFWTVVNNFLRGYQEVRCAGLLHFSRGEFYANKDSSFVKFAQSRHTVRHYSTKNIPRDKIIQAVELAMTAPSACNRQYCRVYCLEGYEKCNAILSLQNGNRGFGADANKILLVTADLEGISTVKERNDVFTNGGIFLMNLCYSLYYYEIAHCVLNWSCDPETDIRMRNRIPIRPSESVISILTCGETPDEFDVAESPRKRVGKILTFVE